MRNIVDDLPNVLSFGQVDTELGYHYRRVFKNQHLDFAEYARYLVDSYEEMLSESPLPPDQIILKGVNLTCLDTREKAFDYVCRVIKMGEEKGDVEPENRENSEKKLGEILLSETELNELSLIFNSELKDFATKKGHKYFDINDHIVGQNGLIDRAFCRVDLNHHLVGSVKTRAIHYAAVDNLLN